MMFRIGVVAFWRLKFIPEVPFDSVGEREQIRLGEKNRLIGDRGAICNDAVDAHRRTDHNRSFVVAVEFVNTRRRGFKRFVLSVDNGNHFIPVL